MSKDQAIQQLIAICRAQVVFARTKKQKLRIYEDMMERIWQLL